MNKMTLTFLFGLLLVVVFTIDPVYANVRFKEISTKKPAELAELAYYRFQRHSSYFDSYSNYYWQDHISFHYRFQNKTEEVITGIQFILRIRDAANKELYTKKMNMGIHIYGRGKSSDNEYFFWEDKPFEKNDAYDRLLPCVQAQNCKVECEITGVIFHNGPTIMAE